MKTKQKIFRRCMLLMMLLLMTITEKSYAQDCDVIEIIGTSERARVLTQLNDNVRGFEYRINRRKQLVINNIQDVRFSGCTVTVIANVTLKRRIRRNARGTAIITGNISELNTSRVCFNNAKLNRIRLSNTLRVGEAFYRWIANKVIPNNVCYSLR